MWLLVKIISRGLFAETLIVLLCTYIFCKTSTMFDAECHEVFLCPPVLQHDSHHLCCSLWNSQAIIYLTVLMIRVNWIDDFSKSSSEVQILNAHVNRML